MPRPCLALGHTTLQPDSCGACKLFVTSEEAYQLWKADDPAANLVHPGLAAKVKNFTKALARHVRDGGKIASEEERQRRLGICRSCVYYRDGRCRHSGCGCNLERKAAWQSESCPLGKW